ASASDTTQASNTAPTAPSNLAATNQTSTSITMSWTASSGSVTEYRVERQNADAGWSQISPAGLTATTFTDTGLTASTTYHYRVYAVNGVGPSADSNQLRATTSAAAATFASADIGATPAGSTTVV